MPHVQEKSPLTRVKFSKLSGSKDSIRKQIGMAITPKGLEIICNAILSSLYKVNYENVMPNIDD